MDRHVDRRTLMLMIAAAAAVPSIAIISAPAGVAQEGSSEATPEASPRAGATPGAGNAVEIGSYDIYFEPKEVTIPADTDVTIRLPNHGTIMHNFSITDHKNENLPFDPIDIDIDPGATEEVTINAPAGDYYFYCNVPGHEAAGMFGTLTAE